MLFSHLEIFHKVAEYFFSCKQGCGQSKNVTFQRGKSKQSRKEDFFFLFFFWYLEFSKISLFHSRYYDFKHQERSCLSNKDSGSLDSDHFPIFMLPRKYFASQKAVFPLDPVVKKSPVNLCSSYTFDNPSALSATDYFSPS